MKPTSFPTTPQRHYCLIVVSLACDDAIEAGIISKDNVTPLLYFFIKAWKNELIHRWLTAKHSTNLRENRVLTLMNFLYEKGSVFEYDCKRSTIAHLLLETGDLNTIRSYKTIMNNFSMDMPPMVASQAERIFTEAFIP